MGLWWTKIAKVVINKYTKKQISRMCNGFCWKGVNITTIRTAKKRAYEITEKINTIQILRKCTNIRHSQNFFEAKNTKIKVRRIYELIVTFLLHLIIQWDSQGIISRLTPSFDSVLSADIIEVVRSRNIVIPWAMLLLCATILRSHIRS